MRSTLTDPFRVAAGVGLLVAGVGIVVQIIGGFDYPLIPPGLIMVLVGAAAAFVPWRWAPLVSFVLGAFILVGYFVSGDIVNLVAADNLTILAGKWAQFLAVLVAVPAAAIAAARPRPQPATRLVTK